MVASQILGYCRPGFEADAGLELQTRAAEHGFYGYFKAERLSGFYLFECPQSLQPLFKRLALTQLIFTRQWLQVLAHYDNLSKDDRLSDLTDSFAELPVISEVRVEHPDTEDGKELSRFCRKFTVPLRQALKQRKLYQESKGLTCLFAFFVKSTGCYLGITPMNNISPLPGGIMRLKFPAESPSRSTLKLDEAFLTFIPEKEREERLRAGLNAVDLGACPGGWTYQLVRRGMFVQAVDNGLMAESLMDSGQVTHFQEDGFKFKPRKKNIHWLVCDMIEQPQKVARLMAQWVSDDWCKEAMFNLKLPMKKRFESVLECLAIIAEVLPGKLELSAKHLYHNRDEITVHLKKQEK
ncbi:23S rRNA (cytidine(2498)-2'-O)-methyltransferase RlmM [Planctobacterium marinum]|uniref:23S rRNA (cytidine(2498)-2'-O)-methyltransferase RlmM n=1 Tax=Planctobacterium marinum TaxID=1631968 RepID=UPI001E4010BA|nr:23S rRNA (cytidine(2498)-2'-O)-methyltransferase RlmM [Planctobacterium marinum]MCC2603905.1 23S rRNA (cytidine(2498)-2'-O)-methyltransferase RlmM [Planctobacterium marinum]